MKKNQFSSFEALLKSHDWTFEFSDDHSVWQRGNAERKQLDSMAEDLAKDDPEKVASLWNSFCNPKFKRSAQSFEPKKPEIKWRLREGVRPNRNFRGWQVNQLRRELGDENLENPESRQEAVFRLTWGVEPSAIERDLGFVLHFPSHPELAEMS